MSSTSEEVIAIIKRAWTRAESEADPLPMTPAEARLQAMRDSHLANIGSCEALL